ncbi:MAG: Gfo/Idh/MocA family oxidoreductase, partial [Chloroflexota bacterium]
MGCGRTRLDTARTSTNYPTNEDSPRQPVIPYGVNKVAADEVFSAAHTRGALPVTVFVPAQTLLRQLGRGSRWLDRLNRGLPVLIAHDGQLVWAECHADDVGVAYGAALGRDRCIGQTYVVTRPGFHTWRDYYAGASMDCPLHLVDGPVEALIAAWPQNTELLASESRWNRIYDLSRTSATSPSSARRVRWPTPLALSCEACSSEAWSLTPAPTIPKIASSDRLRGSASGGNELMTRVLGVGIVGCGVMSTRDLLPNLVMPEVADRLRLAAVCDVVEERARATGARFGTSHVYTSQTQLAEDPDLDIVAVGTPVPHHLATGMVAIQAGKHIYMQKTMTLTVAEAD